LVGNVTIIGGTIVATGAQHSAATGGTSLVSHMAIVGGNVTANGVVYGAAFDVVNVKVSCCCSQFRTTFCKFLLSVW
jgi:hypothetical protein